MPKETGTQAVERAIAILRTFSYETPELRVMDISQRLGLHKSTVHRLIRALERAGLLSRDPVSGHYRLGMEIITLAGLVNTNEELRRIARPWLHKLAAMTEETVSLSVRDGLMSINLEMVLPRRRQMVSYAWHGQRVPAHADSSGKVLLSFLPEQEWKSIFADPLPSYTQHTITDLQALFTEFKKVKAQGYATGIEELEEGLSGVAAPVHDRLGTVVAAVTVSGPTPRITNGKIQDLAEKVMATAGDISKELGWG